MLNYVMFIWLLTLICQSFCLNCLFISDGGAGHVIPVFELAKAFKNHNITFLTDQLTQAYIDLNSYSSPSFRIIYTNDSVHALLDEKNREQEIMLAMTNRSLLDAVPDIVPVFGERIIPLLNKIIDILMHERFDVIVA
ncbi:unnamed protein product, partial [Adineta steineri]